MKPLSGGRPQPLIFGILVLLCLFFHSFHSFAQPELRWAKSMGGISNSEGDAIVTDASGNVFTAGQFYNTADFDPGPAAFTLTAAGAIGWQDIFITKFDANGNFIWAKQLGGTSYEFPKGMTIDASGNLLLTGYFNGTADFDPGSGVSNLISVGAGTDIFICKLDNDGNFVWADRIGGPSNDQSLAIATDPSGNVYTTGSYFGTVDFDPSAAGTSNLFSSGSIDIFISKLDASGNFVWARKFGGPTVENGSAITIDGGGNVISTGSFAGTVDFDPGAGTANLTSAGSYDAYVSKLDANGNFIWAKAMIIGTSDGYPQSIGVDGSDNIITSGYFSGTADFDPSGATFTLSSAGLDDAFIAKLDASGIFVWAGRMGGNSTDQVKGMVVNAAGESFLTGLFTNTADFDPTLSTTNLTSRGGYDVFVAKFSAAGTLSWVEQMGGTNQDYGNAINMDGSTNLLTTGSFLLTSNFGPGSCQFNLTATTSGRSDVFVQSLSQSAIPPPNITGFSPATGPSGTTVTINGTNFSTAIENNLVFFSGVAATVTASTATSITATVPTGTVVGPITITISCKSGVSATNFIPTGPCYLPLVQRNALTDLYNSTTGGAWVNNANWLSVDESTWYGITVSGCRVTEIDLSANGLNGPLPNTITDLGTLQILKLNENAIAGSLPSTIGQLTALKEINVHQNQMTGAIPASLSSCTLLENLQLESNNFSGNIPTFLGSLSNLKSINLGFNSFTGTIPSELGNLSNLTFLSLAENNLTGSIPASLGTPTGLGLIDLSQNALTGSIPVELGSLSALTSLQLWSNQLTGPIPTEIGNLTSLKFLNLSGNQLNGTVPASFGNLVSLQELYLNDNGFSGAMPATISSITTFLTVDLSLNGFTSMPTISAYNLNVADNSLDFGSLEASVATTVNYQYSPQELLPPGGNVGFASGGAITIPFTTSGTANQYQWYRGSNPVPGATSSTLSIPTAGASDAGVYYLQITNTIVTGLTLQSEPYIVTLSTDPCIGIPRTGGFLQTSFDPLIEVPTTVTAVGIQSTGQIIAATGSSTINGGTVDGIVRFNTNGTLDNSFNSNSYYPGINQFIIQPDDKILTTYTYIPAYTPVTEVARLNADGSVDGSFAPGIGSDLVYAIGLQADSKILVSWSSGSTPQLSRLLADGTLDGTFTAPTNLLANVIKVQPDGKILVGGIFPGGITRLETTGITDTQIISDANGEVFDIAIQLDGQIIVVGSFDYFNGVPVRGIVRINSADGTLDNSFNPIGITDALTPGNYPAQVELQSNGKILIAGIFDTVNGSSRKNLVRLNADGTVDCSFDPGLSTDDDISSLTLDASGNIFIAGAFSSYDGTIRNGLAKVGSSSPPTITITTQPSDFSACDGSTATFTAAGTGTTNITYQWQFSPNGSPLVFSDISNGGSYSGANTATLSINPAGILVEGRYRCRVSGDLAAPVNTHHEGLFIIPLPSAPTASPLSVCSGTAATLNASGGVNGQYRWYTSASGGTAITGAVNSTYTTPNIFAATTYYVSLMGGSCESLRAAADVTLLPSPAQPTATGSSACGPSAQLTLTAAGGVNGQYRWYTIPTGGVPIGSAVNDTYVTPSLSATTSYYVSINDGICESPRTLVNATILSCHAPTIASTLATNYIEGTVSIDLTPLIADVDNNVDQASLKITKQPLSGAKASLSGLTLNIDYTGIPFTATESVGIQVCDLTNLCTNQDISIELAGDITIYNAVSPNGDGKNDFFFIQYIDVIPSTRENHVRIFNRWGDQVFSVDNYNNVERRFDGYKSDGTKLPPGTYFYKIEFPSGSPLTGFIDLRY